MLRDTFSLPGDSPTFLLVEQLAIALPLKNHHGVSHRVAQDLKCSMSARKPQIDRQVLARGKCHDHEPNIPLARNSIGAALRATLCPLEEAFATVDAIYGNSFRIIVGVRTSIICVLNELCTIGTTRWPSYPGYREDARDGMHPP